MSKPIVNIVMVTYGHENYIREAIYGVLMQECDFEVELIVANDCSLDATDSIIQDIIENHPRGSWIKYINQEKNVGMMANFIFALQRCKGKYIALCEGDDYWTYPLKLQKQVDFLEANPDYVVCYHDCNIVDENNKQISSSMLNQVYKKDYCKLEMEKGAWMPTLTRCFRNTLNLFPEEMLKITCGDLFLTCLLSQYGKAKYIDICAATYRKHSNGVWNSKDDYNQEKVMINDYKYFCKYFLRTNNKELFDFYSESLNNSFVKLLELAFKKKYSIFIESIYINIKNNNRFFSKYFIKLTITLFCIKIKTILKRFGFYRFKNVWPELSEKKKHFLIKNVSIKSSVETLNDIKTTIANKEKGAYMRFGDGDIFLMLGKDDILHQSEKKMAKEMRQAISFRANNIHKAFPLHSNLFGYEQGMTKNMHLVSDTDALRFLSVTNSFIDLKNIYTPVALHYLATFNQEACVQFLLFLRSTNPIFVGNKNLAPELLRKLFSETHIKTPHANSYLEIDRIEKELIQELDKKKNEFQVIVVAMGCPGRILQKRVLKKGYHVYLFDFGSLLDALNNDNTRLWIDLAGGTENLKNILNKLDN